MGPAATAELFRRITLYTSADSDQEHIRLCILSDPTVPDRSKYLLENAAPSPLKIIKKEIKAAKKLRCRSFAVACNTAHCFCRELENVRGITFINMVKETCRYASFAYPGKRLCVLATEGAVKTDVYRKNSPAPSEICYPSEVTQRLITDLIKEIKGGVEYGESRCVSLVERIKTEFDEKETVFVLGCTELSLAAPCFTELTAVDSTDVLAGCIISASGKNFNKATFKPDTGFFMI